MLVKELIEKLSEMDQEAVVLFWEDTDSSGGWKSATSVEGFEEEEGGSFVCLE